MRLDQRVVAEGLAPSRERARALILAGEVLVNDRPITKAGARVRAEDVVRLRPGPERAQWVSRGALKLVGALDAFGLSPVGAIALDVGASTGGFTQVLLARGARRVYAVDVGYGQLAWELRQDPRVVVLERTNARHLRREQIPEPPSFVTIDVSFIGVAKVLPAVTALCAPGATFVVLVKPQFEVGKGRVGKGGVVRDDALRLEAVDRVARDARALGLVERGRAEAVIAGPRGNREVFLHLVLESGRTGA